MDRSATVTFGAASLDRASALRDDGAALATLAADPAARVLPVWRGKPLFAETAQGPRLAWIPLADLPKAAETAALFFLGLEAGAPRFAADLSAWDGPAEGVETETGWLDRVVNGHAALPPGTGFRDLRSVMALLSPADAGNAAVARGLIAWHQTHGHCARCGRPSDAAAGGWKRLCPACGAAHFPRTDPVVIMLILSGPRVLLGRQAAWPAGMYSLLAGYMEPGETIEDAVRRETREEAGVPVGRVGYVASQPWPFPASLMIGCTAEALSETLRRDPVEIEAVRWATRSEVLDGITGRIPDFRPARKGAIARHLIELWLAGRLG